MRKRERNSSDYLVSERRDVGVRSEDKKQVSKINFQLLIICRKCNKTGALHNKLETGSSPDPNVKEEIPSREIL